MTAASTSVIPDSATGLLADPPDDELQLPAAMLTLAQYGLYQRLEQLVQSDNLSYDHFLNHLERNVAIFKDLMGIQKALHQLRFLPPQSQGAASLGATGQTSAQAAQASPAAAHEPPTPADPMSDLLSAIGSLGAQSSDETSVSSSTPISPVHAISCLTLSSASTSPNMAARVASATAVTATATTPPVSAESPTAAVSAVPTIPACPTGQIASRLQQAIAANQRLDAELAQDLASAVTDAPATPAVPADRAAVSQPASSSHASCNISPALQRQLNLQNIHLPPPPISDA